jgi:hypothetical protein
MSALAAPCWRSGLRVLLSDDRELQEVRLGYLTLAAIEIEPCHVHALEGLRIGILIDSAENVAIHDRLAHISRVITEDELHLFATVLAGEIGRGHTFWALHDDVIEATLGEASEQVLCDRQRFCAVKVVCHRADNLDLRVIRDGLIEALPAQDLG